MKWISKYFNFKFLIIGFMYLLTNVLHAQENFVFENFSIPQGLSNPTINSICEDKYGFLWLGTNDGLSRYDGYEFKVYKNNPSDSTSLPGNTINTICEDNNGNLWIGGSNVLAKYDIKNDNFINVKFDRGQNLNPPIIYKIFIDEKNRIWIGTNEYGVHLLNPEEMNTRRIKFILNDEELRNANNLSIIETSNHEILATDYGAGIFYYNEGSDKFQLYDDLGADKLIYSLVLHEDEFKRLWIGGENSLVIYNRSNKKLENIEMFSTPLGAFLSRGTLNILKDKAGFIWLGTLDDGLYRYNPVDNKFFHFTGSSNNKNSIKSAAILSLFQDSFGNIWIGTRLDGLYKVDPNKQPMNVLKIPENIKTNSSVDRITAIAKSEKSNDVAIGTAGLGVFWGNNGAGEYKHYTFNKNSNSISSDNIFSLTIDAENNLWVGTNVGLDKVNTVTGKTIKYFDDQIPLYGGFIINDLKFDKAGRLFIADRGGVDILYPSQNIIKQIPSISNREFKPELQSNIINLANSSQPIASILKVGEQKLLEKEFEISDSSKVLIVGVGEGQSELERLFDFGWLEDADGNIIWGMLKYSNSFHFQGGMKNRIMTQTLQLKKGKYKLKFQSDVGHSYGNFNVLAPKDSALWGIQVIRINGNQFSDFSKRIDEEIKVSNYMLLEIANSVCISKSYENILWIGSSNQGLFKYNLNTGEFTQYNKNREAVSDIVTNNDVYYVFEDSKGFVWFSTPNGLGKLDPKTEKIKYFTEDDGLPTNLVGAIQEDNYGNLWISSAAGLTTLVRNETGEKESFINIDIKDGLQGYSFSLASWKTNNGELFFGGDNGVNYFIPGRTNQTKPKIVLTDLKISDVSVFNDLTTSPLKKDLNSTEELTLDYSQNDISLQFAPIHYSRPERNLIAYKLEGFNKDWVYSKLHFASFTNLEPGDYTFRLKAANGDGVWSEKEKVLHIEVLPPYWRTTFAYVCYGFLFLGFVFGVDRIQRRRLLTKARNTAAINEAELRAQLAETENERKTKELEEARQLQLSMLPKELPQIPNLDIAVYMKTATEVGGDYYDFNVAMDGTLTVVLGDATGHGMRAGTMVTSAKTLFNSYAANPDILFTFKEMTRCIKQMQFTSLAMSMTMLKIQNNKLLMSAAGMPPVYLFRNKHKIIEEYLIEGMPLGTMENFPYELKEMELYSGDTILLMSDGFPELNNQHNEMFGYRRAKNSFEEVADKEPDKIIDYLKNAGSLWSNDKEPDDDVTFVVIKVK
ncbi:MAG: SpoIIE family protein phosphatase [Ignavibacteriales bacterium]|nr:SpoIIE family protein phosphatase [Ignavibacteriales bacterium]